METEFAPVAALAGGATIGLAAVLLMLATWRIAGISGIAMRVFPPYMDQQFGGRRAFVAGLIVAPLVMLLLGQGVPLQIGAVPGLLVLAGLLVGFGSVWGNAAFVGDTLFMPDGGSARADFPGGDARQLYRSIRRVLALPGDMRLFMCHDYGPNGREIRWETTVADERAHNIHAHDGVTEAEFVALREARDKTLGMPKLIIPALQVNMKGGSLPEPDDEGKRFLKVPLNGL